jgi:hypothetical protein
VRRVWAGNASTPYRGGATTLPLNCSWVLYRGRYGWRADYAARLCGVLVLCRGRWPEVLQGPWCGWFGL